METLQTYADNNNEMNKHRKQFPSGVQAADLVVLPLYGSLPQRRQLHALRLADRNQRKVILATNIAETGLTVPGLLYGLYPSKALWSFLIVSSMVALTSYIYRIE